MNTLSLEQKPLPQSRFKHLKACIQGEEPCSAFDFVILGTLLLAARSSWYALLKIGAYTYHRESENFGDKVIQEPREGTIGTLCQHTLEILSYGPGNLPETVVHLLRESWAPAPATRKDGFR